MDAWEKEWGDILFEKRDKMNKKWMKKKLHLYCTISKIEFYCSITLKILVFRIFSVRDFLLCLACQLPNMAHLMLVL